MFKKVLNKVVGLVERVDALDKSIGVVSAAGQSLAESLEKMAVVVLENRQALNLVLARQDHILRHLQAMGVDEADLFDTVLNNKDKTDLLN